MENEDRKHPQNIEIELTDSEATGTYANLAMITHSPSEFIIDFISMMPGIPKAKVVKRIVLTPDHAKRLAQALVDNINKYESDHGTIQIHKDRVEIPMYRGPKPEA